MKLTKSELRIQQTRLQQFQRYLPTLQLKKAMLQLEVQAAIEEIEELQKGWLVEREKVAQYAPLLLEEGGCDFWSYGEPLHVKKHYENIAGVEIPIFEKAIFKEADYSLFDTPGWTEQGIEGLQNLAIAKERLVIAKEKKHALEKELKEVSIRVNLFEKILIPRSLENIKKIRIFLGDQQLVAVAQAKVAKKKIALRKEGTLE